MIDVLKRLAQLDSQNPNIVSENTDVAECGPMGGMMEPVKPSTPASLSVTAGSGEELGDMLAAIMQLAGLQKVEPEHLGAEPAPMTLTAEPISAVGPAVGDRDDMRSVLDKLNPASDDNSDEETDEGEYDNSPTGVDDIPTSDKSAMINPGMQNQEPGGSPGVGDRNDGKQPKAFATFEEALMSDYQEFIAEGKECKVCEKPMKKCTCND